MVAGRCWCNPIKIGEQAKAELSTTAAAEYGHHDEGGQREKEARKETKGKARRVEERMMCVSFRAVAGPDAGKKHLRPLLQQRELVLSLQAQLRIFTAATRCSLR